VEPFIKNNYLYKQFSTILNATKSMLNEKQHFIDK